MKNFQGENTKSILADVNENTMDDAMFSKNREEKHWKRKGFQDC